MSSKKIFVVIVNFNAGALLHDAVASVIASTHTNHQVVIVDNNSTDGSTEAVAQKYADVHVEKCTENHGFAVGANIGLRHAFKNGADYVLLLNPDATLAPDAMAHLVGACEKERAGIANPLIFDTKGDVWFAGGKISFLRVQATHNKTKPAEKTPYATDYATGCAMLVSREMCRATGFFDERFFLYYEDADMSKRAQEKGFSTIVVPAARAEHMESSTVRAEEKVFYLVLSGLLFFRKHGNTSQRVWLEYHLALRKAKNALMRFLRPSTTTKAAARAYKHYERYYTYL